MGHEMARACFCTSRHYLLSSTKMAMDRLKLTRLGSAFVWETMSMSRICRSFSQKLIQMGTGLFRFLSWNAFGNDPLEHQLLVAADVAVAVAAFSAIAVIHGFISKLRLSASIASFPAR